MNVNEANGLFLLRPDQPPDAWYDCRICGGRHRVGEWARNEHKLLALCMPLRYYDERCILTPPAQVVELSTYCGTDGEAGLMVDCEHPPFAEPCIGDLLEAQGVVTFRRKWDR